MSSDEVVGLSAMAPWSSGRLHSGALGLLWSEKEKRGPLLSKLDALVRVTLADERSAEYRFETLVGSRRADLVLGDGPSGVVVETKVEDGVSFHQLDEYDSDRVVLFAPGVTGSLYMCAPWAGWGCLDLRTWHSVLETVDVGEICAPFDTYKRMVEEEYSRFTGALEGLQGESDFRVLDPSSRGSGSRWNDLLTAGWFELLAPALERGKLGDAHRFSRNEAHDRGICVHGLGRDRTDDLWIDITSKYGSAIGEIRIKAGSGEGRTARSTAEKSRLIGCPGGNERWKRCRLGNSKTLTLWKWSVPLEPGVLDPTREALEAAEAHVDELASQI